MEQIASSVFSVTHTHNFVIIQTNAHRFPLEGTDSFVFDSKTDQFKVVHGLSMSCSKQNFVKHTLN